MESTTPTRSGGKLYQLHWAPSLRAHSAVVLNLAPDHLDWHGSMEAYAADKGRIYEGNRVACVYNVADKLTEELVREADVEEGCRAIGFTLGLTLARIDNSIAPAVMADVLIYASLITMIVVGRKMPVAPATAPVPVPAQESSRQTAA